MKNKSLNILLVICPNGLGHFRRSLTIFSKVVEQLPNITLHVVCSAWQKEKLFGEICSDNIKEQSIWHFDITEPGVGWTDQVQDFDDNRLLVWQQRLKPLFDKNQFDFVFADNLSGVFNFAPQAILLGSFLWSDVLEYAYGDHPNVRTFVAEERTLLKRFDPRIICVKHFAMPHVLEFCKPLECGLMVDYWHTGKRIKTSAKYSIALIGGGNMFAQRQIIAIANYLLHHTDYILKIPSADQKSLGLEKPERVVDFSFSKKDFLETDVVIARPGMGIVQDAIGYGIPMIGVHEPNQMEMCHIGKTIKKLGLGHYYGENFSGDEILRSIEELISESFSNAYQQKRSTLDYLGFQQASHWIVKLLTSS